MIPSLRVTLVWIIKSCMNLSSAKHYIRALQLNDEDYIRRVEEILASNLTEANSILTELSYKEDPNGFYGNEYPRLLVAEDLKMQPCKGIKH